ncbi:MAG: class II D-tagatose-bisphosphate aldolase, non-catalytic subunit [Clostridiales bacterium]|jgi:D-tagatose-1,6-bisphosphate aldolase subunit GatZ/KbaZ|nr:class II D-tagatose-bisphosphate aldolase, non-catalytic subunit [Clostridiales bacterium]
MNKMIDLINRRKNGENIGICSVCSANELVIEAAFEVGIEYNTQVLIEATANQVNQFGGYTGMKPADFVKYVQGIAKKINFPIENLILGGDHLGPLTWQNLNEEEAMANSDELLKQYVKAGFTKIHIDTSMRVADDSKDIKLSDETIARRAARLAKICEENASGDGLAYIIGSEVPIPGGAQENEDSVSVTTKGQFLETFETFKNEFSKLGLDEAFKRVIGVVVQPGVEFADASVIEYDRSKAEDLCNALKGHGGLVFEGHSTDYQTKEKLREMVEDGIAILKVGPALTYYLRQALFALSDIEQEALFNKGAVLSRFKETLEEAMLSRPGDWVKHYHGDNLEKKIKRKYSFSDRCRYYLLDENVVKSQNILFSNIKNNQIPISLYDQYLPNQYLHYRESKITLSPEEIIKDKIKECIYTYIYATLPNK